MLYLDTSFLLPYYLPEQTSERVERFLGRDPAEVFAISLWTMTEFHSAIGIKLRTRQIPATLQASVVSSFKTSCERHFSCWPVTSEDHHFAVGLLSDWKAGLRAGDALHLAIAHRHGAEVLSLDKGLLKAAHHFKIPARTI